MFIFTIMALIGQLMVNEPALPELTMDAPVETILMETIEEETYISSEYLEETEFNNRKTIWFGE